MVDHPGWYPPSQVCSPPELPTYLKNVYDLKPIVGLPNNAEVIGIHTAIQAATRAASIPGMHDPSLTMKLADHLFSAQMAVYRSKYTSLLFPSDATFTPPTLPAHVSVNLEPISCAPTDDHITKVHEAIRSYQKFSEIPTMFEPQVHADLSQYLFDIQMARYMYREGQRQPNKTTQDLGFSGTIEKPSDMSSEEPTTHHTINNAGSGAGNTPLPLVHDVDIRGILERSNQLAERANQLSERSNQLIERSNYLVEQSSRPAEQPTQPTNQSDKNIVAERLGELIGRLNQYLERSNQLTEGFKTPVEQMGDALRSINKVLVGVQHAINHRDNTAFAIKSLVNEKGDLPIALPSELWPSTTQDPILYYRVGSQDIQHHRTDKFVAYLLRFYGIEGDFFDDPEKTKLHPERSAIARKTLARYLTGALGT